MKKPNLPKVISILIDAQNQHDSETYVKCFSTTAQVFDEGHTYEGHTQIEEWIKKANEEYQTVLEPLEYDEVEGRGKLKARISGSFKGSPAILNFHFEIVGDLIESLEVTG